jgi:hypothetical protein
MHHERQYEDEEDGNQRALIGIEHDSNISSYHGVRWKKSEAQPQIENIQWRSVCFPFVFEEDGHRHLACLAGRL